MAVPKRVGVVELFVDVQGRHESLAAALMSSIRRTADVRRDDVLNILRDPRTAGLDLIVFPGWTVVDTSVPAEIVKAAGKRTVVIEILPPVPRKGHGHGSESGKVASMKAPMGSDSSDDQVPWRTYVIHGGTQAVGPVIQRIITSSQAGSGDTPSQRTFELARELRSNARSWSNGCSLWVCGEVNALYGRKNEISPWLDGLRTNWRVVANPAHTPNRLQAMRDKRAHLSRSGVLFTTANTHSAWMDSTGKWRKGGGSAAEVYLAGRRFGSGSRRGKDFSAIDMGNHRLIVVE